MVTLDEKLSNLKLETHIAIQKMGHGDLMEIGVFIL